MNSALLTSAIVKVLRFAVASLCAWLVGKGYLQKSAVSAIVNFLNDYYVTTAVFLIAAGWDIWAHLAKASWIIAIKERMGQINPTAKPDQATLKALPAMPSLSVLGRAAMLLLVCGAGISLSACSTTTKLATAAASAPTPGQRVMNTVEGKVAALTKTEIVKHPAIAPYADGVAKGCRSLSGLTLPSPIALTAVMAAWNAFAPGAISGLVGGVVAQYAIDYPIVNALDKAGTPYLELVARGIQDGETQAKAASTGEAP